MNNDFSAAMRRAARATRATSLLEATRIIQDALAGRKASAKTSDLQSPDSPSAHADIPPLRLTGPATKDVERSPEPASPARGRGHAQEDSGIGNLRGLQRQRRPLGEVLRSLREGRLGFAAPNLQPGVHLPGRKKTSPPPVPAGAHFLTRSFTCAGQGRHYKLYIPASAVDRPRGLVVMLHGCKQDPDDFAAGTNMNVVAEANGLMVAYPAQSLSANASSCWNWFNPADQMRDQGEPSVIAGITRHIMSEFGLGRQQVFVAGLSAGGAMAAVMSQTYPDLYAAAGIHSGLAHGSAKDVITAFAAMRGEVGVEPMAKPPAPTGAGQLVRTIVFQGSVDRTVHPSNAERIAAAASQSLEPGHTRQELGGTCGGRQYSRTVVADVAGVPFVEHWLIDGAGHAWSGGHPSGSYADPQGPDASEEMMRFFLSQPTTNRTS